VANERFKIGIFFIPFAPDAAEPLAELIEHKIDVRTDVGRHDRWRKPLDLPNPLHAVN
jgi:hypothetical protein